MKPLRDAILLTLLLVFAVVFTACQHEVGSPQFTNLPELFIAKPGADITTEIILEEDIEHPENDQVGLYKMKIDGISTIKKQLSQIFDETAFAAAQVDGYPDFIIYNFENGDTLMIEEKIGFYSYVSHTRDREEYSDVNTEINVTDEKAIDLAKVFLSENDLFYEDLGEAKISYSTVGGGFTKEYVKMKDVYFSPTIDGNQVYGIYRIMVTIGYDGCILGVSKHLNNIEECGTVNLRDRTEITRMMEEGDFSPAIPDGIEKAFITNCSIAYYCDAKIKAGEVFIQPVYMLTGKASNGESVAFDIILDAVKRDLS